MVKPPGRCIFCGRRGLSKEHIWSEWTYKLVPKVPGAERDIFVLSSTPIKTDLRSRKTMQGSPNVLQVRKVCKYHCNSGWMSALETKAEPLLTPLILGETTTIEPEQQKVVATWLAMKGMVAEFTRPVDVTTTQEERSLLMNELKPPDHWRIYIAKQSGNWWRTAYYRHTASLSVVRSPIKPVRPFGKNAQSVTIGIGALLAHIVSAPAGIDFNLPAEVRRNVWPIWPTGDQIIWPPPVALNDTDAQTLATAMERTLSATMRWIP